METIIKLTKDEFNSKFIDNIINSFPTDYIEIKIKSIDETEYLLSESNKEHLLESLQEYKEGKFIEKTIEELELIDND